MKAIPRSKAKTAYGLISDVRRAILAEPRRVDMMTYCSILTPELGGPACGTVGCFAGWVLLLSGASPAEVRSCANSFGSDPAREAKALLGADLNYQTEHDDFVFDVGDGNDVILGEIGTITYARNVAKRITYFQKVNAKALKARRLP